MVTEDLLETVSSVQSDPRLYMRTTVALWAVGGNEMESLESETVNYGHESHGTWTREWLRWREPAAIVNDRLTLLSERAPHINKPAAGLNVKM
jgi:hypothetical protein